MQWTVRRGTSEDASVVRDVARESWHAAYDAFLGPETVDETVDDWYRLEDLESSIADTSEREDAVFLVVESTASGGSTADVDGFAHAAVPADADDRAVLIRLYVRPDRWGGGAGTALLERLEADLQPAADRLSLTVFADNEVGVSFYESAGFERVETRRSDLGAGLEEYVYEKPLGNEGR